MSLRSRRAALAGLALFAVAALSGCIKVDMDIELAEDGTARGEAVLAVSEELLDLVGGDPAELFTDTNVPADSTVEEYEQDGFIGQRYTFENADIDQLVDEDFSISHDEEAGRFEVTGSMDFASEDDLAGLPGDLGDSLAASFDVSISVTFPGDVIEHNGELDGRTVTWRPGFDDVTEIHAIAEDSSSGVPGWLWGTLAGVAALLLAGLAVVLGRRRATASDEVATEAAGQPQESTETRVDHESPAEAAVHGDVAPHEESPAESAVHGDVAQHEESPADTAVHGDVAPHEESPASEGVHDVAPHEQSPPGDAVPNHAVPDDIAPHEQSPGGSALGDATDELARGDVPTDPTLGEDKL